jgi:predicted aspartyl protease
MCKGEYRPFPCELFVEAVVGIGSVALKNAPKPICFLVDTGALDTTISAADASRLGVSFSNWRHWGRAVLNDTPLTRAGDASGVGGKLKVYKLENVYITIISDIKGVKERHTEHMDIVYVASPEYRHESLMGMDLLKRFKLLVDPSELLVSLTRIPALGPAYSVENF